MGNVSQLSSRGAIDLAKDKAFLVGQAHKSPEMIHETGTTPVLFSSVKFTAA